VLVDETFPQEPFTAYGRNKRDCEQVFLAAHRAGAWKATIIRPSCTYGPGGQLIDMLEGNPVTWDRVARGLPVLMAGDGLGLWQATHRDDCGKAFAYAVLNPKTYGEGYNATLDEVFTWNDYYRLAAQSLGKPAKVIYMSADWIIRRGRGRFGLLADVTRFHGAYTSAKAKRDMPEFRCEIPFARGAAETLADCRRRGAWPDGAADALYQGMVDEALKAGMEPVEL
jgi:nucleoside-diphosphate-sugar epimerase